MYAQKIILYLIQLIRHELKRENSKEWFKLPDAKFKFKPFANLL